jgi:hypothetical protein
MANCTHADSSVLTTLADHFAVPCLRCHSDSPHCCVECFCHLGEIHTAERGGVLQGRTGRAVRGGGGGGQHMASDTDVTCTAHDCCKKGCTLHDVHHTSHHTDRQAHYMLPAQSTQRAAAEHSTQRNTSEHEPCRAALPPLCTVWHHCHCFPA